MNVYPVLKFLCGDKSISDKKGLTLLTAPCILCETCISC